MGAGFSGALFSKIRESLMENMENPSVRGQVQ